MGKSTNPYENEQFVQRYDRDNAPADDHAYYRAIADAVGALKIVDFGCGTGLLTRTLATPGRVVLGVDPSATMLTYARRQPRAEAVTWIHGDASALPGAGDADLALSSGNTMMHIRPDEYPTVLGSLRAALKIGGIFTFETRNAEAKAWRDWNPPEVRRERDTSLGVVREHFTWDSAFSTTVLYFRRPEDIAVDLERAGFGDIDVAGGWHDEPVTTDSRVLVFRAVAR